MDDFRLFNKLQPLLDSPTKAKRLIDPAVIESVTENKNRSVFSGKLSVVIVAYNESAEEIRNCLQSLHATITQEIYELVAVDNGLQDAAAKILRNSADKYVKAKKNLGCCAGRNIGSSFCSGQVILFVDADGILELFDPTAIRKIVTSNLIAIRGQVVSDNPHDAPPHYNLGDRNQSSLIDAEGISLWHREFFTKAGGFNEDLKGNEGIVLAFRLITYYSASPDQFYYMPSLRLRHEFAANTRFLGHSKQKYYYIQFLFLRKIYPGIETYVRKQLKLRNRKEADSPQRFRSRLAIYMTRITTSTKFTLYLLYKKITKPSNL